MQPLHRIRSTPRQTRTLLHLPWTTILLRCLNWTPWRDIIKASEVFGEEIAVVSRTKGSGCYSEDGEKGIDADSSPEFAEGGFAGHNAVDCDKVGGV